MKKELSFYRKAKKDKSILKGTIVLTQYDEELESDILLMDLDGLRGVVKRENVDYQMNWKSLVGFIGRDIYYVVEKVDEKNKTVFCSRKTAQEMVEEDIINRLKDGEAFEATVSGIVKYGAYVDIQGIYALLKNSDFSDDHVSVGQVLGVGDVIGVTLKEASETNKLSVEPIEKYVLKTVLKFDSFERDQVVLGTVNGIKPWGAYVTIAPGLDALCPIPPTGEIEEGTKVSFRITQVQEDKQRVRGKILRILQS